MQRRGWRWEKYKDEIINLYQNDVLKNVMQLMKERHGFDKACKASSLHVLLELILTNLVKGVDLPNETGQMELFKKTG